MIAPPPVLFLACVAAGVVLHRLYPLPITSNEVSRLLAWAFLVVPLALATWAIASFKRSKTHVRPDRPATVMVTSGPYAWTRNPMYVSLCLLQAGIGFWLNDWCTVLLVLPLFALLHFGVILREERYLEGRFGAAYTDYQQRVRRWL